MGSTLAGHIRLGFTLGRNFEAVLDSKTPVLITAVLDRTAVYEIPGAPVWFGRRLATFDRFTVEDPSTLTYHPIRGFASKRKHADIGRSEIIRARKQDPNRCPGSNQLVVGDIPLGRKGTQVICSECGQQVFTYPRKDEQGLFRSGHQRPLPIVGEDTTVMPSETDA